MLNFFQENFGNLRICEIENKIYFVATDIAQCIGHTDAAEMCEKLCKKSDLKTLSYNEINETVHWSDPFVNNTGRGGARFLKLVSENGLYRILAKSRLPKCEPFENWVFDEVIPTIRKTGAYSIQKESYAIDDPIERAKAWIAEREAEKAAKSALEA